MTETNTIETIASRLGIPFQSEISDSQADTSLLSRLPLAFARNNLLLPLREDAGTLLVATSDPANLLALDEVGGLFGMPVQAIAVPPQAVLEAINRLYTRMSSSAQDVVEELEGEDLNTIASELNEPRDLLDLSDEAPVIRLLNSILFQAVKEQASDIHIEPYEREVEVGSGLTGFLQDVNPAQGCPRRTDLQVKDYVGAEYCRKELQDGRILVIVAGRNIDIRVSIIPTFFGERVVLRLLDKKKGILSLEDIGISGDGVKTMDRLLCRNNGIILVTGPTGSGKSTTLYAALNRLNSSEKNIITVEDPIEYQLKGVGQIQVNPKIDLTFANGLRSILRQDPDIIMVGEIRDVETAEIAIQASLTGHLVFSTLHTNDAATAITRLIDMGMEPFMVASSLSAVLAQRLVRLICPHCKEEYSPEQVYPGITLPPVLYRGKGCDSCFGLGTLGRTLIHELLLIDADICSMIIKQAPAGVIKEYAISRGMKTLRDNGLEKAAAGITTIQEVMRVTQEDYADLPL
jgi:general secretion pathway protein E